MTFVSVFVMMGIFYQFHDSFESGGTGLSVEGRELSWETGAMLTRKMFQI